MKVSYHEKTDSAYISFVEGMVSEDTREIAPDVNVDIAADGHIIGIEIVSDAKAKLTLSKLAISGLKSVEFQQQVS